MWHSFGSMRNTVSIVIILYTISKNVSFSLSPSGDNPSPRKQAKSSISSSGHSSSTVSTRRSSSGHHHSHGYHQRLQQQQQQHHYQQQLHLRQRAASLAAVAPVVVTLTTDDHHSSTAYHAPITTTTTTAMESEYVLDAMSTGQRQREMQQRLPTMTQQQPDMLATLQPREVEGTEASAPPSDTITAEAGAAAPIAVEAYSSGADALIASLDCPTESVPAPPQWPKRPRSLTHQSIESSQGNAIQNTFPSKS